MEKVTTDVRGIDNISLYNIYTNIIEQTYQRVYLYKHCLFRSWHKYMKQKLYSKRVYIPRHT